MINQRNIQPITDIMLTTSGGFSGWVLNPVDLNKSAGGATINILTSTSSSRLHRDSSSARFIKDLRVLVGEHAVPSAGYQFVTDVNYNKVDMNKGAGGNFLWLVYSVTSDEDEALKSIMVIDSLRSSQGSDWGWNLLGLDYRTTGVDLNKGTGSDDDYIYLLQSNTPNIPADWTLDSPPGQIPSNLTKELARAQLDYYRFIVHTHEIELGPIEQATKSGGNIKSSVTIGTSTTEAESFSASIGVKAGVSVEGIGEDVSETYSWTDSMSFTTSKLETHEIIFNLPPSIRGRIVKSYDVVSVYSTSGDLVKKLRTSKYTGMYQGRGNAWVSPSAWADWETENARRSGT